ncbi:hypothetical protein PPERSA_00160 [Pseudocohnilembus persalinus]|uniref:Uncharacterized protein n=1 Tax=Pseudocohnilembus persalinus TaxID=266149 RepID=A0A0V0QI29_PSEPJ|nr:hypothetical protein PPERSA_00160 [Pseudocohnilembus persalinus]|eukprot:KRX01787.1 hypothetical protein PPERSA_00160 [Pseudocohnilembus persalinus]
MQYSPKQLIIIVIQIPKKITSSSILIISHNLNRSILQLPLKIANQSQIQQRIRQIISQKLSKIHLKIFLFHRKSLPLHILHKLLKNFHKTNNSISNFLNQFPVPAASQILTNFHKFLLVFFARRVKIFVPLQLPEIFHVKFPDFFLVYVFNSPHKVNFYAVSVH